MNRQTSIIPKRSKKALGIVALSFVAMGVIMLLATKAATGLEFIEPEEGTVSGAMAVTAVDASAGKYLLFSTSLTTPTPTTPATPTPTGSAGCGSGGTCTSAEVAAHSSEQDCWVIVSYTAFGGNGSGSVYKIAASFLNDMGAHDELTGAPTITAADICGRDISGAFDKKHQGGSRMEGASSAVDYLTSNGNSLIGPWSGN